MPRILRTRDVLTVAVATLAAKSLEQGLRPDLAEGFRELANHAEAILNIRTEGGMLVDLIDAQMDHDEAVKARVAAAMMTVHPNVIPASAVTHHPDGTMTIDPAGEGEV